MTSDNDKISSYQVGVFVFNSILGVGILTLPSTLVKLVGTDAWLLAILSGLANIPFLYFVCKVGEKYGEQGFLGILKSLFGKYLGLIVSLPVFAYLFINSGIVARIFGETVKLYLLNNTPLEFIVVPLLILAVFLARSGVEPICRFFEAVTPVIVVIMIVIIIIAFPNPKQFSNLRPYLVTPVMEYIKGLRSGAFSFSGFEVLVILYPFIKKPKETFKSSLTSLAALIVLYTVIIIECLCKFGEREVKALIYPTMTLVKASEIPGGFIERMEGLLISLWVLFVFTTLVALMYGFSVLGGDLLKQRERKHILSMFLPLMYLTALIGDNIAQLFDIIDKVTLFLGTYTVMILPTAMFIMMLIKRKAGRGKKEEKQNET